MAAYEHRDVVETPIGATSSVTVGRRFSAGQIIGGLAGAVLLIVGIFAVTRNGVDSSLNQPVSDVMGLSQSALIGLIEIGAGLLLVLCAATPALRGFMGAIGALTLVGGIIVAAAGTKLSLDLGADHASGWFMAVIGAIAMLGSLMPLITRTDRRVESTAGTEHRNPV